MKYLISGATGNVGAEVSKLLAQKGIGFRAMVRAQGKAGELAKLAGAELVNADFDDRDSVLRALEGVDHTFLLTNSTEHAEAQQLSFVEAARKQGVKLVVKLSQWAADPQSPVRFLRYHAAVEEALTESGMAFVFVRPNLFMQGLLGFRQSIVEKNQFFAPIGSAKVSIVDVRDIAAVAAAVLLEPGHAGKTYNVTGPEALTHAAMAEHLSKQLGRTVTFTDGSEEAMRGALLGMKMPEWQADGLLEDYAHYRRGEAAAVTSDVEQVTGFPARPFVTFARDYAAAFSR